VTAPDHPCEPARGPRPGDHDRAATARRTWERVSAARSAGCPCQAPAGTPCCPDGDHLARYLHAWQAGTLTRESLKHAIDGLDVIAPQAVVPAAPSGHAPRPQAATAAGPAGRHQARAEAGPARAGAPVNAEPELEPG
jgi:hypothetical protein